MVSQHAVRFQCRDDWLFGVASVPAQPSRRGVVVVVGGPQYRVGSHRQFLLLARALAERGIAVLRFDYRGMGDSEGAARPFDRIDDDLRAAVDCLTGPAFGVTEVVLWGLCDGASAAMLYAGQDARVSGLVLANPWARSVAGFAKATLKLYYRRRLADPDFWRKIGAGRLDVRAAVVSLTRLVRSALARSTATPALGGTGATREPQAPLDERLRAGLAAFSGKVLLITSTNDLTAQEFLEMENSSAEWKALLARPQVSRQALPAADHTFSKRTWRDQVARHTADWIESW